MENATSSKHSPASVMYRNPTSGLLALIMGILGFNALPLLGSILAVIFGYQSRKETLAHPQAYVDDFGRAGRVLGWIGIGLAALMLVLAVAFMLFVMPMRVNVGAA